MNANRLVWVTLLALATAISGCGPRGGESAASGHEAAHAREERGGESEERAVELTPEAVRNAALAFGVAGPAAIATVIEAPGEIHLDAERVLEIRPRYAGVVREIRKSVGDPVRAGEVVAIVQSNESLADYEIVSALGGSVIARPAVNGQAVDRETVLMTVADLSSVWADFAVYPQHVGRIRTGLKVGIADQNRPEISASGTIRYVGPLLEQDTRVSSARVVLANPRRLWQPGQFVTARVLLESIRVPVAVPEDAVVRTAEGPATFVVEGLRFVLRPVEVGRSDGRFTEIRAGLAAGDSVVTANAFILKSELSKGEVEHED